MWRALSLEPLPRGHKEVLSFQRAASRTSSNNLGAQTRGRCGSPCSEAKHLPHKPFGGDSRGRAQLVAVAAWQECTQPVQPGRPTGGLCRTASAAAVPVLQTPAGRRPQICHEQETSSLCAKLQMAHEGSRADRIRRAEACIIECKRERAEREQLAQRQRLLRGQVWQGPSLEIFTQAFRKCKGTAGPDGWCSREIEHLPPGAIAVAHELFKRW